MQLFKSILLAAASTAGCLSVLAAAAATSRPNIIFFFQDDQDVELGGLGSSPMPKTQTLLRESGSTGVAITAVPVCCPSRVSLWSGRAAHNNKAIAHEPQGWCSDNIFANGPFEDYNAGAYMTAAGYTTGFYGKYLNDRPNMTSIPPGWASWFMMIHENKYYSNDFAINGSVVQYGPDDYLTTVLRSNATQWLHDRLLTNANDKAAGREVSPIFLTIADHAPHVPATPEPKYENTFAGHLAPRTPSWNASDEVIAQHHWLIRSQPPMRPLEQNYSDTLFQHRWETLRSVDDMIEAVWDEVVAAGEQDNTYVFLSADHGYHLGELRLPMHKCTQSSTDIRVPFLARGPGIKAGQELGEATPLSLLDMIPTWVELAGATHLLPSDRPGYASTRHADGTVTTSGLASEAPAADAHTPSFPELAAASGADLPSWALDSQGRVIGSPEWLAGAPPLDGRSMLPVLMPDSYDADSAPASDTWRQAVLSEYWGLVSDQKTQTYSCFGPDPGVGAAFVCDSYNNTFALARFTPAWSEANGGGESVFKYVAFQDDENFTSAFNLTNDPWNMYNVRSQLEGTSLLKAMQSELQRLANCSGASCY